MDWRPGQTSLILLPFLASWPKSPSGIIHILIRSLHCFLCMNMLECNKSTDPEKSGGLFWTKDCTLSLIPFILLDIPHYLSLLKIFYRSFLSQYIRFFFSSLVCFISKYQLDMFSCQCLIINEPRLKTKPCGLV